MKTGKTVLKKYALSIIEIKRESSFMIENT